MRSLCLPAAALFALTLITHSVCAAGKSAAEQFLKEAQKSGLALGSAGPIAFGPAGLLLVGEPRSAAIVAMDTGDTGPMKRLAKRVDNVPALVAAALGAPVASVQLVDMAVNTASGKVYFSVTHGAAKAAAIVVIDAEGKASLLDTTKLAHVRVPLPAKEAGSIRNISDLAFAGDRLLVTGQSNEEFSSKIFTLPLPLAHQQSGKVISAETYHVAHGKWETKAPIQSFFPLEEGGKHYVVGAFACTPIAKFPVDEIASGQHVRGTSVVELGSGNRPLDLFTYQRDGKRWVVANTLRFQKNLFGPSKYWGVRVSLDYVLRSDAAQTNEKAARRNTATKTGPDGIEILDALFGAVQVDKLSDSEMVVLRENGDRLDLELAVLP
jgi:hypothetical protein